jgi:hypothetical protein
MGQFLVAIAAALSITMSRSVGIMQTAVAANRFVLGQWLESFCCEG